MTPKERQALQRANARMRDLFPKLQKTIWLASRFWCVMGVLLLVESLANMALTGGVWWQAKTGNPLLGPAWPEALLGLWFLMRSLWAKKSPKTYCRCFWGPYAGYAGPYRVYMGSLVVSWVLLYSSGCAPVLLAVLATGAFAISVLTATTHLEDPRPSLPHEDSGFDFVKYEMLFSNNSE